MRPLAALAGVIAVALSLGAPASVVTQAFESHETPRVATVQRALKVLDYSSVGASIQVSFQGTARLPQARGEAQLESLRGTTDIKAHFDNLPPAAKFGPPYLTYVLWAVTDQGRPSNLGEVERVGDSGKVDTKAGFQVFGLIVTAEPYFAVSRPSDLVVMENVYPAGAPGRIEEATYELLPRATPDASTLVAAADNPSSADTMPLSIQEARRALSVARSAGAERYATDTLKVAEQLLKEAEDGQARNLDPKTVKETASEATRLAEDARILAVRRVAQQ